MPRIVIIVLTFALLAYPFGVYLGLQYLQPKYVALILLTVLVFRYLAVAIRRSKTEGMTSFLVVTIVSGFLCIIVLIYNRAELIRLNPVIINLALFFVFVFTLIYPPSMVERFARLMTPDLPDEAIVYTRNVTKVWCVFFIINAIIAFYTCYYTSIEVWTLYNGLIAYLLMGLLFIIEYSYRRFRLKAGV